MTTEEVCLEVFAEWAHAYPTARFVVLAVAPVEVPKTRRKSRSHATW